MSYRTNSVRAWIAAARVKTLSGAIVPVVIGLGLAYARGGTINVSAATSCLLFALILQIAANFINDYIDFRRGADDISTRLGPLRACTMGWITPRAMILGIAVTTALACLAGLPLLFIGGWPMLLVGLLCVIFCFLYTTTLARRGLGDLLVILFFGLIPVCLTYYLQVGTISGWVIAMSIGCGLVIDNLLIINNYRDIDDDRSHAKRTLVVRIGPAATEKLYFFIGWGVAILLVPGYFHFTWPSLLMLPYIVLHCKTYQNMLRYKGRDLNKVLAATARNNLIFGLSYTAACLLGSTLPL